MTEDRNEEIDEHTNLPIQLFALTAAGLALVFAGVLVIIAAEAFSTSGGSASTGIVAFIGPFPIVFGAGPDAGLLILIGVVIAAVSIALFVFLGKKF